MKLQIKIQPGGNVGDCLFQHLLTENEGMTFIYCNSVFCPLTLRCKFAEARKCYFSTGPEITQSQVSVRHRLYQWLNCRHNSEGFRQKIETMFPSFSMHLLGVRNEEQTQPYVTFRGRTELAGRGPAQTTEH